MLTNIYILDKLICNMGDIQEDFHKFRKKSRSIIERLFY